MSEYLWRRACQFWRYRLLDEPLASLHMRRHARRVTSKLLPSLTRDYAFHACLHLWPMTGQDSSLFKRRRSISHTLRDSALLDAGVRRQVLHGWMKSCLFVGLFIGCRLIAKDITIACVALHRFRGANVYLAWQVEHANNSSLFAFTTWARRIPFSIPGITTRCVQGGEWDEATPPCAESHYTSIPSLWDTAISPRSRLLSLPCYIWKACVCQIGDVTNALSNNMSVLTHRCFIAPGAPLLPWNALHRHHYLSSWTERVSCPQPSLPFFDYAIPCFIPWSFSLWLFVFTFPFKTPSSPPLFYHRSFFLLPPLHHTSHGQYALLPRRWWSWEPHHPSQDCGTTK